VAPACIDRLAGASRMLAIYRKGQPTRASRYVGPRCKGVGKDNPKASDHCPVLVDIPIGSLF
jgi:hypothetical protein